MCQDCPNEVISIKCDAQAGVSEIQESTLVGGSKHWILLAFCKGHQCIVAKKARKLHGIQVLSIERGTLTLKRTSWKGTRHPRDFMCTVTPKNAFYPTYRSIITIDFSVECK